MIPFTDVKIKSLDYELLMQFPDSALVSFSCKFEKRGSTSFFYPE